MSKENKAKQVTSETEKPAAEMDKVIEQVGLEEEQLPETAMVEFDPIAAAFETSVENASKTETDVTEDDKPKSKETIHYPSYPNVNVTVEVSPKLLTDSKGDNGAFIADFAGDSKAYARMHGSIARKIEASARRESNYGLKDFETVFAVASEDAPSVEEASLRQYVDNATWQPNIATPTTNVPIITPIKNPDYGDSRYIGPEAVSLIRNRMKIGCKLGVFLPHTGVYCIINSPGDDDLLDTLSVINSHRVEALRQSSGILLGNSNFYLYKQILNLFIDNLVSCSLVNWNKEILLGLIDERDMDIISTVLQASIYPDGYEYRQLCGLTKTIETDKGKVNKICEHVTAKWVDLRRMVFVDNTRLSETQRNVAAGGLRHRSIEEIKSYQETNYLGYKKAYEITPGISFVYKSQPISTVIAAGEEWIKEIESTVDSIITFNEDDGTRNNMIKNRIDLTSIREYSHWVVEIQIDSETNSITDRARINEIIKSLSRSAEVLDKVSETLSEFQRLSQVAIVAIPRVKCPKCNMTSDKDLDICAHLIPQDATSRFFTLAHQRLS